MPEIWAIIGLVSVGAFVSRGLFFFLTSRVGEVPESAHLWLSMVPPAAFAALVCPAILVSEGQLQLLSAEVVSAVAATLVAWRTKSIAVTILIGLVAYLLLSQIEWLA